MRSTSNKDAGARLIFHATPVSLANLWQVAFGDKGMAQALDPEHFYHTGHSWGLLHGTYLGSLWNGGCAGDEIPTWIPKAGRQIPPGERRIGVVDTVHGYASLCLFLVVL